MESAQPDTGKPRSGIQSAIREILETVLLTLLIFVLVRALVQNFKVEGSSMEPNLHSGQYLLVNKAVYFNVDTDWLGRVVPFIQLKQQQIIYLFEAPQRGDVVVFRYPQDPSRDFIKRVIAVPGDTVEVRSGRVLVNGAELAEPYIRNPVTYSYGPRVVPPDQYFVLGDNRNNSHDSHVWGTVPRENIVGKAWLVYWPANSWGLAPNYSVAAQSQR